MTAITASYFALPFKASRRSPERTSRSLVSEDPVEATILEHGTNASGRDVIAAWLAAVPLGALCLLLLAS